MVYVTDKQLDSINHAILLAASLRRRFPEKDQYSTAHDLALSAKREYLSGNERDARVELRKAHSYLAD